MRRGHKHHSHDDDHKHDTDWGHRLDMANDGIGAVSGVMDITNNIDDMVIRHIDHEKEKRSQEDGEECDDDKL